MRQSLESKSLFMIIPYTGFPASTPRPRSADPSFSTWHKTAAAATGGTRPRHLEPPTRPPPPSFNQVSSPLSGTSQLSQASSLPEPSFTAAGSRSVSPIGHKTLAPPAAAAENRNCEPPVAMPPSPRSAAARASLPAPPAVFTFSPQGGSTAAAAGEKASSFGGSPRLLKKLHAVKAGISFVSSLKLGD